MFQALGKPDNGNIRIVNHESWPVAMRFYNV
jgi:hypothetical protein